MADTPDTPFHDLQDYLALPRLSGLALSSDGSRLVTTVAALDPEGTRLRTALWEIDPAGARPARRLTRGAASESAPVFTPDGELLFTSARPNPESAEPQPDEPAACGGSRRPGRRTWWARAPAGSPLRRSPGTRARCWPRR